MVKFLSGSYSRYFIAVACCVAFFVIATIGCFVSFSKYFQKSSHVSNTEQTSFDRNTPTNFEERVEKLENDIALLKNEAMVVKILSRKVDQDTMVYTNNSLQLGMIIPKGYQIYDGNSLEIHSPKNSYFTIRFVPYKQTISYSNQDSYKALDETLAPMTILGSERSFSSFVFGEGGIGMNPDGVECSGSFLGTHYFTPINNELAVEIILGEQTGNCDDGVFRTVKSTPADIKEIRKMLETLLFYDSVYN